MESTPPEDTARVPTSKKHSGFVSALSFWKEHDSKLRDGASQPASSGSTTPKLRSSSSKSLNVEPDTPKGGAMELKVTVEPETTNATLGAFFHPSTSPRDDPSTDSLPLPSSSGSNKELPVETLPSTPTEQPIKIEPLRGQKSRYWSTSIEKSLPSPSSSASRASLSSLSDPNIQLPSTTASTAEPVSGQARNSIPLASDHPVTSVGAPITKSTSSTTIVAATKHRDGHTRPLDLLILNSSSKLLLQTTANASSVNNGPISPASPSTASTQSTDTTTSSLPSPSSSVATQPPPKLSELAAQPPSLQSLTTASATTATASTATSATGESMRVAAVTRSVSGDSTHSRDSIGSAGSSGSSVDLLANRIGKGNISSPGNMISTPLSPSLFPSSSGPSAPGNARMLNQMGGSVGSVLSRHKEQTSGGDEDIWSRSDQFYQELQFSPPNGSGISIQTRRSPSSSSVASPSRPPAKPQLETSSSASAIPSNVTTASAPTSASTSAFANGTTELNTSSLAPFVSVEVHLEGSASTLAPSSSTERRRSSPPPTMIMRGKTSDTAPTPPLSLPSTSLSSDAVSAVTASASSPSLASPSSSSLPSSTSSASFISSSSKRRSAGKEKRRKSGRREAKSASGEKRQLLDSPTTVAEEIEPPSPRSAQDKDSSSAPIVQISIDINLSASEEPSDSPPPPTASPSDSSASATATTATTGASYKPIIIPIDLSNISGSDSGNASDRSNAPDSAASRNSSSSEYFPKQRNRAPSASSATPSTPNSASTSSRRKVASHKPSSSDMFDRPSSFSPATTGSAPSTPTDHHRAIARTFGASTIPTEGALNTDGSMDTASTPKRKFSFLTTLFATKKRKGAPISPSTSSSDLSYVTPTSTNSAASAVNTTPTATPISPKRDSRRLSTSSSSKTISDDEPSSRRDEVGVEDEFDAFESHPLRARPRGNSMAADSPTRAHRNSDLVDLASPHTEQKGPPMTQHLHLVTYPLHHHHHHHHHNNGHHHSDLLSPSFIRSSSNQHISLPSSPYESDSETTPKPLTLSADGGLLPPPGVSKKANTSEFPQLPSSPRVAVDEDAIRRRTSSKLLHRRNSLDPNAAKMAFRSSRSNGSSTSTDALVNAEFRFAGSNTLSPHDTPTMGRSKNDKRKDKKSSSSKDDTGSSSPPSPHRIVSVFGIALDTMIGASSLVSPSTSHFSPRSPSTSAAASPSPRCQIPYWLATACQTLTALDPAMNSFAEAFSRQTAFTAKDKATLRRSIEDGSLEIAQETDPIMIVQAIVTFLEDLPDALCTYKAYSDFMSALAVTDNDRYRLQLLHTLIWALPPSHRCTLIMLIDFILALSGKSTAKFEPEERERRLALATEMLAPYIFRPKSYSTLHTSPRPYSLSDLKGTSLSAVFSGMTASNTSSTSTTTTSQAAAALASLASPQSRHLRAGSISGQTTSSTLDGESGSQASGTIGATTTNQGHVSVVMEVPVPRRTTSPRVSPHSPFVPSIISPSLESDDDTTRPSTTPPLPEESTFSGPYAAHHDSTVSASSLASPTMRKMVPPLHFPPPHAQSMPLVRTKTTDEGKSPQSPNTSAPPSPSSKLSPRSVSLSIELLRLMVNNHEYLLSLDNAEFVFELSSSRSASLRPLASNQSASSSSQSSNAYSKIAIESGTIDFLLDLLGNPFYRDPEFVDALFPGAMQKLPPEEIFERILSKVRSGDSQMPYVRVRGALLLTALTKWVHSCSDSLTKRRGFYSELESAVLSSKDEQESFCLSGLLAELTISLTAASNPAPSSTTSSSSSSSTTTTTTSSIASSGAAAMSQSAASLSVNYVPPLDLPIISHSSEVLAQHLTLIDLEHLKALRLRKAIEEGVSSFLQSDAFLAMTTRFNTVSRWAAHEVVSAPNTKERVQRLVYFANVTVSLVTMNNFNGALAIFTGLSSVNVSRMSKTMSSARKRCGKILDALESLFSMHKNSKNYTDRIKASTMPIIPQIVLYARNLSSLDENNASFDDRDRMNVCKFKDFIRIANELLKYQKSVYYFHKDLSLYNALMALNPISDDEIYQLSLRVDPKK